MQLGLCKKWEYNRASLNAVKEDDSQKGKKPNEQPITQVRYRAVMKVKLDKNNGRFMVLQFNLLHNHELVCSYQLQFLRSSKNINEGTIVSPLALQRVGVNTRQIMELFVVQLVGISMQAKKKNLQNALNEIGYR